MFVDNMSDLGQVLVVGHVLVSRTCTESFDCLPPLYSARHKMGHRQVSGTALETAF